MLSLISSTIKKNNMFNEGDNVIAAVSGGPDSVALLFSLYRLKNELNLGQIVVAHLNHMFRGQEAEDDALFVKELAKKYNLIAEIEKKNIPDIIKKTGLSPEDAARRVRYEFLYSLAKKYDAKIALGHHADDQAETVLMHLLQGSGLEGIAAMECVRDIIVRPLLFVRRSQIEEFCKENDLETRIDSSNKKDVYYRNKIRLNLIPLLVKEYNPNLVENLVHTSEIMRAENKFMKKHTEQVFSSLLKKQNSKIIYLVLNNLIKEEKALRRRIIRHCYELLVGSSKDFTFKHVESVLNLAEKSQVGSIVNLPNGISAKKNYNELEIGFLSNISIEDFFYELFIPGNVYIPSLKQILRTEVINASDFHILNNKKYLNGKYNEVYLNYDKIPNDLFVRNRRKGDRFTPCGMHGTKKLKDFFIDEKVPREKRNFIPLVTCGVEGNDIIWIVGYRVADKYKINGNISNILKITLIDC